MGGGEVIPDGSIHWNLIHDTKKPWKHVDARVKGSKQEVSQEHGNLYGVDAVPGNHPKTFHVTLRFESEQEAAAALRMAQATLDPKSGMWQIEFRITAVHRKEAEAEIGPPNPFAQIVYEWK